MGNSLSVFPGDEEEDKGEAVQQCPLTSRQDPEHTAPQQNLLTPEQLMTNTLYHRVFEKNALNRLRLPENSWNILTIQYVHIAKLLIPVVL